MNDQRYTLDWRGTQRGPWTLAEIETRLEAGEINSLYRLHVDGRWVVLRDFLEQKRAEAALARKQAAASLVPRPEPAQVTHQTAAPLPPASIQPASTPVPNFQSPVQPLPKPRKKQLWGALVAISVLLILFSTAVGGYLVANRGGSGNEVQKPEPNKKNNASEQNDSEEDALVFSSHFDSISGKDIFPSAIISTARIDWNGEKQTAEDKKTEDDPRLRKGQTPLYGDENGWLSIRLEGVEKNADVVAEVAMDGFMKPSKWHGVLTKVGKDGVTIIRPKIAWDYEALRKVRQERPANISYSVSVNGVSLVERVETVTVKSINDCILAIKQEDEDGADALDLKILFAAYVNEAHPLVEKIRKEAINSGIVSSFAGDQSEKPADVILQVFAIWNALQRRGIKYSSIAKTTPSEKVFSQSVRFLDESIDANQANCVDGAVLMASILHKIGIRSYLVLIPGHCFLGFYDGQGLRGLETTMLGNDDLTPLKKYDFLPDQAKAKEFEDSLKTFAQALAEGTSNLKKFESKFQSTKEMRFQLISISKARELGITPIGSETQSVGAENE